MFIISGGRGTGKTKALLEKVKEEKSIIACADPIKMLERAHRYGITGLEVISYDELESFKQSDKVIYIHNINSYLTKKYPTLKGYSLNID